ncbi:uncharacterized protein EDB93DRAFT_401921 [Suillus bovinus]|uniref:uncharacterized protein n=1 Tax=Suillus bovinus TaxID=48563 RepID=UPI001B87D7D8|nr:uncharacterized protein EDB93DRAFT_401921 [Suillus bovinus]KAG2147739.1 hypothetical protein EDB93DRAFT_401921 [Suillus bovinus]
MTIVSNDPTLWPAIEEYRFFSYFVVAAFVMVTHDWALTFAKEVQLIWMQRWSLMTVLYLSVRYLGIFYAAISILGYVPTISLTDKVSTIVYAVPLWTSVVVFSMLGVITIARLYAMYRRSRKILIFLIVIFLANNIFSEVVAVIITLQLSGEEFILSGTYQCSTVLAEDGLLLDSIAWILGTVWEVLVLCLAMWSAIKHFSKLRQYSSGDIVGDCFTVLMKTHVVYFANFAAISCFQLVFNFSRPFLTDQNFLELLVYSGLHQIFTVMQLFVLGPRLILSIREYYANLVTDSDAATGMTSIAFQEHVHTSTGSGV